MYGSTNLLSGAHIRGMMVLEIGREMYSLCIWIMWNWFLIIILNAWTISMVEIKWLWTRRNVLAQMSHTTLRQWSITFGKSIKNISPHFLGYCYVISPNATLLITKCRQSLPQTRWYNYDNCRYYLSEIFKLKLYRAE